MLVCAAVLLGACSAKVTGTANNREPTSAARSSQLQNTYWKLMTLNNVSVQSPQGTRELHLKLNSDDLRVQGFSGCNSFMGAYELEGPKITFSRIAGTMMACAGDMSIERRILEMLGSVRTWQISGETLRLMDQAGTPIATFESRDVN